MYSKFSLIFLTFITMSLLAMEHSSSTTIKSLPDELKARTMLFITAEIEATTLEEAVYKIKETIKADAELQKIFESDNESSLHFTEKLISVLKKKFAVKMPNELTSLCIASALSTPAALKIIKDRYLKTPKRLATLIKNNFTDFVKTGCAKELLTFAEAILPLEEKQAILKHVDRYGQNILLLTIRAIPFKPSKSDVELIKSILKIASIYLNDEEKQSFINNAPILLGKPSITPYDRAKENQINPIWNEIKMLLEEHGAQERNTKRGTTWGNW